MSQGRWVSLNQLADEVGMVPRTLQYIRTQEPGVLVTRTKGSALQYKQPDCAINLRQREANKAKKLTSIAEAEQRKAIADAELAETKLARLRGELAPVAQTEALLDRILGAVRTEVLGIRPRYLDRLLGVTDRLELAGILDACANDILRAMSDGVAAVEPVDDEPEADADG